MAHGTRLPSLRLIRSAAIPILRRLKDDDVIRPASANRNTVKALEEHGLIVPAKGRDTLTIVWRIRVKQRNNRSAAATPLLKLRHRS